MSLFTKTNQAACKDNTTMNVDKWQE